MYLLLVKRQIKANIQILCGLHMHVQEPKLFSPPTDDSKTDRNNSVLKNPNTYSAKERCDSSISSVCLLTSCRVMFLINLNKSEERIKKPKKTGLIKDVF